jgi:hypothetical protein
MLHDQREFHHDKAFNEGMKDNNLLARDRANLRSQRRSVEKDDSKFANNKSFNDGMEDAHELRQADNKTAGVKRDLASDQKEFNGRGFKRGIQDANELARDEGKVNKLRYELSHNTREGGFTSPGEKAQELQQLDRYEAKLHNDHRLINADRTRYKGKGFSDALNDQGKLIQDEAAVRANQRDINSDLRK